MLAEHMTLEQAATLMGVTTRHTRRILAAYRELGAAAVAHSKPSPQLITRVGRGRSIFNEPEPAHGPGPGAGIPGAGRSIRKEAGPGDAFRAFTATTSRTCCGWSSTRCSGASARAAVSINPTICMRFEADHIVARSDGGDNERRNVQLLCGYCNRVKGTQGDAATV